MNLKTLSACLLVILLVSQLTACATASPKPDIIIFTPTSQPTPTTTPEPSATPSPLPTEANTAIPTLETSAVIPFSEFATFTLDRFVPIFHDARIQMNRDIASGKDSAFPDDVSGIDPIKFPVAKGPSASVLKLSCKPSVNCTVRYAVNDGIPMMVWEMVVKGPDGNNIKVPFTTAHIDYVDSAKTEWPLAVIQSFAGESAEITLNIMLFEKIPGVSINPDVQALYDQVEARRILEQGVFDEFTGDTAWCVTNSSGHP